MIRYVNHIFGFVGITVLVLVLIAVVSGGMYYYVSSRRADQGNSVIATAQPSSTSKPFQGGAGEDDFIEWLSSSFGLRKSIYVDSDGSFRIINEIAASQKLAPKCQDGKMTKQKYESIVAFVLSTGFFDATIEQDSDFSMCEGGDTLRARIGTKTNQLWSICLKNHDSATQSTKRSEQIMFDVYEKLNSAVEESQKKVCERR